VNGALGSIVDRLSRIEGVRGAVIVDIETGLPVLGELSAGMNGNAVAALAASIFRRTSAATDATHFGGLATLQLEAESGYVIVAAAGELLLVVVAERSAQLGRIRVEAASAAGALV
jgi:predicted regulator of Ras-like GTPase activity (Roadblock/LC7/MglB family)